MSDDSDFDKEAERERLREKYERDQKKREQSERMSELLLQGATMTNRHCGDCGDPIFRHEDKEFCPTCQKQVGRVDADAEQAGSKSPDVESAAEQPAASETPTQAGQQPGAGQQPQQGQPRKANGHATPQGRQESGQQPSQPQQPSQQSGGRTPAPATDTGGTPSGGLADAEAALARTIEKYARGAEESGDVGRARDYLAAAREAAEALEAVRRAE